MQNPLKRLGAKRNFKNLKSHPFFKGIKFEDILEPPIMPVYKKINTITEEITYSNKSKFYEEEPDIPQFFIETPHIEDKNTEEKIKNLSNNLIIYEGKIDVKG